MHVILLLPMLLPSWLDPEVMLRAFGGYAVIGTCLVLFIECAIWPILPGDSLLFTVGLFTANGLVHQPLWLSCIVLTVFAVLGNVAGYWFGRFLGPRLFKPRRGLMGKVFDPKHIDRTNALLDRYGNRALIMARFVPFVRTFITWVAGAGRMDFRRFITYTAIGGVAWATGVTVLGYYLGQIAFIHAHIEAALILIVVISVIPMAVEAIIHRRKAKRSVVSREPAGS